METVLIIGGSSGIGYETAKLFSINGYKVFNASRSVSPDLTVESIPCDVTRPGDIERAIDKAGDYIGSIRYLIYSAGYSMAAPIAYAQESDYRYLFEVNYFGLLKSIFYINKFMKDGGRILAVSSVGGTVPIPFDAFYSSSKAAVDMLIKTANLELNDYGIYLTSVKVGGTSTRFTFKRNVYPEEQIGEYGEKLPKAAVALANIEQGGMNPEDVGQAIYTCAVQTNKPTLTVGFKNVVYTTTEKLLPESLSGWLVKNQYLQ